MLLDVFYFKSYASDVIKSQMNWLKGRPEADTEMSCHSLLFWGHPEWKSTMELFSGLVSSPYRMQDCKIVSDVRTLVLVKYSALNYFWTAYLVTCHI